MPRGQVQMTAKETFRLMGGAILLLSIVIAALVAINLLSLLLFKGGRDVSRMILYPIVGVPLGIGLRRLRKWAALLTSIALGLSGCWLITDSLLVVAFPGELVNVLFGLLLFLPSIATVVFWKSLSWRAGPPIKESEL